MSNCETIIIMVNVAMHGKVNIIMMYLLCWNVSECSCFITVWHFQMTYWHKFNCPHFCTAVHTIYQHGHFNILTLHCQNQCTDLYICCCCTRCEKMRLFIQHNKNCSKYYRGSGFIFFTKTQLFYMTQYLIFKTPLDTFLLVCGRILFI